MDKESQKEILKQFQMESMALGAKAAAIKIKSYLDEDDIDNAKNLCEHLSAFDLELGGDKNE